MKKKASAKSDNLDQFIQAMSRVLGIPRKRLYRVMFQGTNSRPPRRVMGREQRDLVAK